MSGYTKNIRKVLIASATAAVLTIMMALPASAHIVVSPDEAPKGSYGVFSFRVPNESDTATTTKVEIQLPEDHPIASVRTTAQDGWNATAVKTKPTKNLDNHGSGVTEVVSKITWEGGTIKPGEYAEFHVSMGALPDDVDVLEFKAVQTYSDGDVVSWIQSTPEGGEEPDYPAPTLLLTKATGDEHGSSMAEASTEDESHDDSSNTVAYVGVGLGAVALLVALGALIKKK